MKVGHTMPEGIGKRPGRKASAFTTEVHTVLDSAVKTPAYKKSGIIVLSGCEDASKVGSAARSWAADRKPYGTVKATVSVQGDTVTIYNRKASAK